MLRVAETLLEGDPDAGFQKDPDSGFAVLLVLFPYFEMIARHRAGKEVGRGFEKGLCNVFGEERLGNTPAIRKEVTNWLWDNMRNELAHNAFTGKGIAISGSYAAPIVWDLDENGHVDGVGINPHLWVKLIRKDFENFVEILRDPANTRERAKFLKYAKRYIRQT